MYTYCHLSLHNLYICKLLYIYISILLFLLSIIIIISPQAFSTLLVSIVPKEGSKTQYDLDKHMLNYKVKSSHPLLISLTKLLNR